MQARSAGGQDSTYTWAIETTYWVDKINQLVTRHWSMKNPVCRPRNRQAPLVQGQQNIRKHMHTEIPYEPSS